MNRTRMIEEKYDFIIFFNIVQYKIARVARNLINSVPHVQYIHKSELAGSSRFVVVVDLLFYFIQHSCHPIMINF